MRLADLDSDERGIVLECLRASVAGPFFPIWEFFALFGLEHQQVADIAFGATPLDDALEDVNLAIGGALNNLTGYPHRRGREVWDRFISASPEEVSRICEKWFGR